MKGLRRHWPLLLAIVPAALLRLGRLSFTPLIGDEAYYWLWSRHLALSYLDHPPGIALLIRVSTWIGGESEVGIRWLNAILGIASVALVYWIGYRLYSRWAGLIAASVVALGVPYLLTSRFVYTDALQLFLLLLATNLLLPFFLERGRQPTWRYVAIGLTMALLFNTKYNAYLYGLTVALKQGWTRRQMWRDRRTWLAVLLAACGILPALIWNARHDWMSFRWQLAHFTTEATGPAAMVSRLANMLDYVSIPIWLLAVLGLLRLRDPHSRWLVVLGLVLVLPVVISPANSPRNLTTGLVLWLIAGGDVLHHWLTRPFRRGWARVVAFVPGTLFVSVGFAGLMAIEQTALGPLPMARERAAALAIYADTALWHNPQQVKAAANGTIFAIDYSLAGQLTYYLRKPAYTSWPQYQLWGIPPLRQVTIFSRGHIPDMLITTELAKLCGWVSGPYKLASPPDQPALSVWRVENCNVPTTQFLEAMDFLRLFHLAREQP